MKEMMLRLPVVELSASDDALLSKFWPGNGHYILRLDNGEISVVDVQLKPIDEGFTRPTGERLQNLIGVRVGTAELLDPDDWVLAIDLENAKKAYEAEAANQKEKCDAFCKETEENCMKLIEEKEQNLAARHMELEHEYEKKQLQLELDTPKRFAQGEWVSGKTLTEIIRALTAGKKEG